MAISGKKVLILYKKEDYDKVDELNYLISRLQYLQVTFSSVEKHYHRLWDFICKSDFIILFWSSNSIKSKRFKYLSDWIVSNKNECYSVYCSIDANDFLPEDSHFKSIPLFWESKYVYTNDNGFPMSKEKENQTTIRHFIGKRDVVNFAVFAPHQIQVKNSFTIDLWAYLENQYNSVLKKSEEIKRDRIIGRHDSVPIKRKSLLTVTLNIKTLNVKTNYNYLYWEGEPASTSFLVTVPESAKIGVHFGTAKIYFRELCIADLIFRVNVSHSKEKLKYQDMLVKVKKYRTAFASYSSKDSSEVYSRVHGMTKIAPDLDIFLSRLSLKSSEKWEEALLENVPNKDVFYLFWSRNALKSEWVDKEWRLALRERDLSYIDPVPLESPKLATPPPELSALHFDDIWVALKHENDFIDTYAR